MKIPSSVIVIGRVESVSFLKKNAKRPTTRSLADAGLDYILATNRTHTALYLFQNQSYGKKKIVKDRKGVQRGAIHTEVKYKVPTLDLKKLGKAVSIQYTSDNWEGVETLYRHEFKDASFHANSYTRFSIMAITPKRGKIVNTRGITS